MLEEEEESRKIICLNNQQIFPSVLDSPNRGVSSSSALWPPYVPRQGLKRSPTNDETTGEMNLTTTMNIIPKMTFRISENVNIQKVRQIQRLIIIFWGCVQYSGKEAEAFAMNPIHRSSSSRDLLFYHLSVSLPGWKMGRDVSKEQQKEGIEPWLGRVFSSVTFKWLPHLVAGGKQLLSPLEII